MLVLIAAGLLWSVAVVATSWTSAELEFSSVLVLPPILFCIPLAIVAEFGPRRRKQRLEAPLWWRSALAAVGVAMLGVAISGMTLGADHAKIVNDRPALTQRGKFVRYLSEQEYRALANRESRTLSAFFGLMYVIILYRMLAGTRGEAGDEE